MLESNTLFLWLKYIWEEICWPYKAPFWCHIFCIFEHLFWQLRGVLCQNFQYFLKIYECQIVYIPLFWPVLHRGPVQLPVHFTLPQKIVAFQNIICSLFSPFFVLFSHIIDGYDVQGYPVCLEGHLLPLKPKIKCSWHTSAIYGWKNNHKLEGWNTSMNELRICWKNVNLARGAAEAVTHIIEEDLHMQHKTKAKLKQLHSQSELFFQP